MARRFPALAAALATFAACGGATSTPIAGSPGDPPGQAGAGATPADGGSSDGGSGQRDAAADAGGASDPGTVACGAETCTVKGPIIGQYCCIEANAVACKSDVVSACGGHRVACDEALDCNEDDVCCAEGDGVTGGKIIATRCMPTCVTGAARIQVCKTDDECEDGKCRAYDCGGRLPASLRFCQKPEGCK